MASDHCRYHIEVSPAAAPAGGYPAQFHLDDGGAYVKYGHMVFMGSAQRGDPYWTAEVITQTWYQAEAGRIPISGAGYGGKFAGQGFEGIWLDMSEIVRPTRDGIHGRETISTQVDLGGGVTALAFDGDQRLRTTLPPAVRLPLPMLLGPLAMPLPGRSALIAIAQAAQRLGTLGVIYAEEYSDDLAEWGEWLAPRLSDQGLDALPPGWNFRYLEIEAQKPDQALALFREAQARWPDVVIALRLALSPQAAQTAAAWAQAGVPVIHLYADDIGQDAAGRPARGAPAVGGRCNP